MMRRGEIIMMIMIMSEKDDLAQENKEWKERNGEKWKKVREKMRKRNKRK